jgi:hypothetical protein
LAFLVYGKFTSNPKSDTEKTALKPVGAVARPGLHCVVRGPPSALSGLARPGCDRSSHGPSRAAAALASHITDARRLDVRPRQHGILTAIASAFGEFFLECTE